MSADWATLRKEARGCENDLEQFIQSFSRISVANENPTEPLDEEQGYLTHEEAQLARQIEASFSRFLATIDKMSKSVMGSPTREQTNGIVRNREILNNLQGEFRKLQSNLVRKRESALLLKKLHNPAGDGSGHSMEPLLRERGALQSAHKSIDSILGQAAETKDTLVDQRRLISSSATGVNTIATMFPTLNKLMGAIQFKKTRENIVLALVIAACICFTIWYLFG